MNTFDVAPLDGYHPEYGLLLAALQDGTREWLGEIGEPSEDAIVWQPMPGSYSIGGIVMHIAWVEAWWFEEAALGRMLSEADCRLFMSKETDVDEGVWPTPPRQPWAWYLQVLMDVRARTLQTLRDFPDPQTMIQRPYGPVSLRWILAHVVQHDSYHGGQAVLLHTLHSRMRLE